MSEKFAWLLEIPGPLYLSTAASPGGTIGFTPDAFVAWRFPSKAAAELVAERLDGAFGAKAVEHGFCTGPEDPYDARQALCKETGTRYYGDGGTIHGTTHLDVEVHDGRVVSVWFRCQPLPYRQVEVAFARADSMTESYRTNKIALHGVEVKDG